MKHLISLLLLAAPLTLAADPPGGALANQRPRVFVSTDIGGGDPDDHQSLIHLLLYADLLDLEGLVASPPKEGRAKDIHDVINAYQKDYINLQRHSDRYPSPDFLRLITKQGAENSSPGPAPGGSTPASSHLTTRALSSDPRPLWVIVWGGLTDVAQAIHDKPSIKNKIRLYSIGSWNTRNDQHARDYLYQNHRDLWWIENDTTFRGMYMGGDQSEGWGNRDFVQRHVKGHGALGELFVRKKPDIKMGDSPSLLYLLRGNPDDPTTPHWGGAFIKTDHGPNYWHDNPAPDLITNNRPGAKTVNTWRKAYLKDWQTRQDRVLPPSG